MPDNKKGYTGESIQVLEGLEPVRKRPAMYIGSTSQVGVNHCLNEIVDNAIDEALAGYCKNVMVRVEENGYLTVFDDGRGIPIDKVPKYNVSALEIVMTKLHAGGKFGDGAYKVSGGLHGVGASVVNVMIDHLRSMGNTNAAQLEAIRESLISRINPSRREEVEKEAMLAAEAIIKHKLTEDNVEPNYRLGAEQILRLIRTRFDESGDSEQKKLDT